MMDYEKYNNALEKARLRYNEIKDTNCNEEKFLLELFPELKESEDERIRKALVRFHKSTIDVDGIKGEDILAWLEKQKSVGEIVERCKNSWYNEGKIAGMAEGLTDDEKYQQGWHDALEKQGEQKVPINDFKAKNWYVSEVDGKIHDMTYNPADKVEPKLKIESGKWYVCIRNLFDDYGNRAFCKGDVYLSEKDGYLIPCNSNVPWELTYCVDTYFRNWDISDAKDGDVLACENGWTCIFNCLHDNLFNSHCFMDGEGWFCEDGGEAHTLDNRICGEIYPATKEQRDLLFKKIKEAGYEWDAEKKELKLLISNGGDFESNNSKQKPTWSDEDEENLQHCCGAIGAADYYTYDDKQEMEQWLKSLKERLS